MTYPHRYHDDPAMDAAIQSTHRTHPYYASAIGRLRIIADPSVPTMATSDQWVTHYNPAILAEWSVSEAGAVLVHELEHLLRDHAGRCEDRDHAAWNIAGDAEINARLTGLPEGAVYPETLGMPRGRSAEVYYSATGAGRKPKSTTGDGDGSGDGDGQPGGPGAPAKCGSAAGGGTQDHERGDAARPGSGVANGGDDARQEVAESILGGEYPGTGEGTDLRQWAEAQIGIDRNAWMTALASVTGRSVASYGAPTRWRWPGRRDPSDMGGAMVPRWVGERPSVAVIIDTSSSIAPADLDIARVAATFLSRHADATFYGCSTRAVRYGPAIPDGLTGGGGTDLRRGIEMAIADGHKAIVIVTDCGTPWPSEWPGVPVIIGANIGARGILDNPNSPYYPPQWTIVVPITQE